MITFLQFVKMNVEQMYDEYKRVSENYMTLGESYSMLKAENARLKEDLKESIRLRMRKGAK